MQVFINPTGEKFIVSLWKKSYTKILKPLTVSPLHPTQQDHLLLSQKQWLEWHQSSFLSVFIKYRWPSLLTDYNSWLTTSNNQRLPSSGDSDRRSKHFCSIASVLCVSFTWQMVKTRVIRLRVIEGPNAHDRSAFCAFHSFLVEVQTNAGYIHADACVKTTWRLGLWAPLVASKTMAVRSVS